MIFHNILYPDLIIESLQNDELVIFAGAGISIDPPTNLPNFRSLTKEIAKGTGKKPQKNTILESFLGELQANNINVHTRAATILSGECLEPNDKHKAVISLFKEPSKVRIVTTNYDTMLEYALGNNIQKIYNTPALPAGNDFDGIVHLHGTVNDPNHMILTDADFGKAYLTEGYAARFLVQLFESYNVLFIGYSYNDTILRYLTRAMSTSFQKKRFILTDNDKNNNVWKSLGLEPIFFPKNDFNLMRDSLISLGATVKRRLLVWRDKFSEFRLQPPQDKITETEIEYCLQHKDLARNLATIISGNEWLEYLDQRDIFDDIFAKASVYRPKKENWSTEVWTDWLLHQFVGKNDKALLHLFTKKNNNISQTFKDKLIHRLESPILSISNEAFCTYIQLLDDCLVDSIVITNLMSTAYKRNLIPLCFHIFKRLFNFSITVEIDYFTNKDEITYKPKYIGDYHSIKELWETYKKDFLLNYSTEILLFIKGKIEDLHYSYAEVNLASKNTEPYYLQILNIENEKNDSLVHIILKIYFLKYL